jgi:hypothetical protein
VHVLKLIFPCASMEALWDCGAYSISLSPTNVT